MNILVDLLFGRESLYLIILVGSLIYLFFVRKRNLEPSDPPLVRCNDVADNPHNMLDGVEKTTDRVVVEEHSATGEVPIDTQRDNSMLPTGQTQFAPDCNQTSNGGVAIAWVKPSEDSESGELVLDMKPFTNILSQPEIANLPVAIVTVNGRMRTGKSFILNQIIRYLKFPGDKEWMDKPLSSCFEWRQSLDGVTTGILLWPEPFIVTQEDGKKIAVILLDTQGIHDTIITKGHSLQLFGLSLLISSLVIYNERNYGQDTFTDLYDFVNFTTSMESDAQDDQNSVSICWFGKLLMLFRDWQNQNEYPCGLYKNETPGPNLRNKLLEDSNLNETARLQRQRLVDCFHEVLAYAMPGPGSRFPDDSQFLQSCQWDPKFKKGISEFLCTVFGFCFLAQTVKSILGREVTAGEYVKYIEKWTTCIKTTYQFDNQTFFEKSVQTYFENIISFSVDFYKEKMNQFVLSNRVDIECYHNVVLDLCKQEIWLGAHYSNKKAAYFQIWLLKSNKLCLEFSKKIVKKISSDTDQAIILTGSGTWLAAIGFACAGGLEFATFASAATVAPAVAACAGIVGGILAATVGITRMYRNRCNLDRMEDVIRRIETMSRDNIDHSQHNNCES